MSSASPPPSPTLADRTLADRLGFALPGRGRLWGVATAVAPLLVRSLSAARATGPVVGIIASRPAPATASAASLPESACVRGLHARPRVGRSRPSRAVRQSVLARTG